MVTLVDVPKDNIIIVIDPTNPSLGIYTNGNIKMFNSTKKDGLKYEPRKISEFFTSNGYDEVTEFLEDYANSFQWASISKKSIEEKYGLEAQNQALKDIREWENNKQKTNSEIKKTKFVEQIKVKDLAAIQQQIKMNDEYESKER